MCRLALFNAFTVDLLGIDVLEYHFATLEIAQGGDGMGVASMGKNGIHIHKGLNMGPREAARWVVNMRKRGAKYFVFHTRLATSGSMCTENCHPYRHGDMVMAHNGVVHEYSGKIGDRTDSEVLMMMIARSGADTSYLERQSGVFVGFRAGRPFVVKGYASSQLMLLQDGPAYMFTSQADKYVTDFFGQTAYLNTYAWYGMKFKEQQQHRAAVVTYAQPKPKPKINDKYRVSRTAKRLLDENRPRVNVIKAYGANTHEYDWEDYLQSRDGQVSYPRRIVEAGDRPTVNRGPRPVQEDTLKKFLETHKRDQDEGAEDYTVSYTYSKGENTITCYTRETRRQLEENGWTLTSTK